MLIFVNVLLKNRANILNFVTCYIAIFANELMIYFIGVS
jgi:hypothetical protein